MAWRQPLPLRITLRGWGAASDRETFGTEAA